jgi:hypothetical protein
MGSLPSVCFLAPGARFTFAPGATFLSERNQFVLIIAHVQGFHVFELVQSAA